MRRGLTLFGAGLLAAALLGAAGCARSVAPAGPVPPQSVFKVRAALLNLLKCPSVTCSVIDDLRSGQEVAALSPPQGDWVLVRVLPSGPEGYVEARFLGR